MRQTGAIITVVGPNDRLVTGVNVASVRQNQPGVYKIQHPVPHVTPRKPGT